MDRNKTINSIPLAEAGKKNWFLSAEPVKQNQTLNVKLNNGKTYKYLAAGKACSGDQVIIDYGGSTSYQMGNVESIEKGHKVKKDVALQPLFTFSVDPSEAAIKESAAGIKSLISVDEVYDYFGSFESNEERFRVVDYLVKSVLNAINVIAFPDLVSEDDISLAKGFLAVEKPVPGLVFGQEFDEKYYDFSECAEVAFTGFYPGWKDDMESREFLQDPKFEELAQDMDIEFDCDKDYVAFFYFDGSDEHERFFSDCKDFRDFTNELVFRSALSILIRGGFLNLLQAALSVEMPIKGFYDKLIDFAKEIGSTECADLLENVDYKNLVFEKTIYDEPKEADTAFDMEGTTLIEYKGKEETVIIPEGTKVIESGAFEWNDAIKKVIMPDSVTQIKRQAFCHCSNLEEIIFSKKLSSVGRGCFMLCKTIKSVDLSQTKLKTLKQEMFDQCSDLTEIKLPKTLKVVEDYALRDTGFTEIVFPPSVEKIGLGLGNAYKPRCIVFEGIDRIDINTRSLSHAKSAVALRCKKGSALWKQFEEANVDLVELVGHYSDDFGLNYHYYDLLEL